MRRPWTRLAAMVILVAATRCSHRRPPESFVEPSTGIRFVLIPAGRFEMGSPPGEPGHRDDERLHAVVIRHAFYLSATEVTQQQWVAVMGSNPSAFKNLGGSAPVERVSWFEVQEFLRRLNRQGHGRFRLPTEAEWEYACRAGTTTSFNYGEQASTTAANFDGPMPARVATFPPNRWGLYDMHGNVWEWCADEYCPYPSGEVVDPWQKCGSRFKVIRGGSWYFGADSTRSALRYTHEPQLRGFSIGFRVVRELDPARVLLGR